MSKINRIFDEQIAGRTAEASGERWVSVRQRENVGWAPRSAFVANGAAAFAVLSRQGVDIIGREHMTYIQDRVAGLKEFPPGDLITTVGWNGAHFALQDGTVFSPKGKRPFAVTLEPTLGKNDVRGKMEGWSSEVAAVLADLPLAMFCLMLAFVGPFLALTTRSDNFGFELVGGKGIGKSTLQRIIASVWGGIGAGSSGRYFETFDTTLNGLEIQLRNHADSLLILDEAALFFAGSSDRQRAAQFQAFAFKMATGDEKGRLGASRARGIRMVYLSSSNEPLEEIVGTKSVTAGAAGDRLITVAIPDRLHGVFEHLPDGFDTGSALAKHLILAAGKHHGHAIRVYLRALVDERATNEKRLCGRIEKWVGRFQREVGADQNSGTQMRVAEAFGLVYAAGRLAQRYGALPSEFGHMGRAVANIYRLYLARIAASRPILERLTEVAEHSKTIALQAKRQNISPKKLRSAPAFTVEKEDHRELLIRSRSFVRLFSDHKTLLRQREVKELMTPDGRGWKPWRTLAPGVDERVYVFRLPALPDQGEDD